jgi:hypothetical protein
MKLVFNNEGVLVATGADAASAYSADEICTVADSVSGVLEMWRYSYDADTSSVVVRYADMTDAEALAQLEIDAAAEADGE